MAETPYAEAMKAVVAELHPRLKALGFRKRRHTFNREPEPGLIQVVNFQMGPYEVGDPVEIPGLRENLYGRFAVNLGVFLDELHASLNEYPRPKFVNDYNCELRKRLGELMVDDGEVWWSLDHGPELLGGNVWEAFEEFGLPWLDRLASRDTVLQAWYRDGNAIGLPPRGQFAIALVHWHRGERELGERLARQYLAEEEHVPGHMDYVRTVLERVGMAGRSA